MKEHVLIHHGIKGQKWGVRRFQNSDGTLTSAGKSRYNGSVGDTRSEAMPNLKKLSVYSDNRTARSMGKKVEVGGDNAVSNTVRGLKKVFSKTEKKHGGHPKEDITSMPDDELQKRIRRLNMEKQYKELNPSTKKKAMANVKKGMAILAGTVAVTGAIITLRKNIPQIANQAKVDYRTLENVVNKISPSITNFNFK